MGQKKKSGFPIPWFLRAIYRLIDFVSSRWGRKFAANVFFTVPRFPLPDREIKFQNSGARRSLWNGRKEIRLFSWGPQGGEVIFLVHGWAGRATQMGDIAEKLAYEGFQVVGIDMPAHGESDGKRTSLIEFERTIKRVYKHLQVERIHGIIGHSMGGVASILACKNLKTFDRCVIIGAPSDTPKVVSEFAEKMGMNGPKLKSFIDHMESIYKLRLTDFSAHHMARELDIPGLIVHDEKDQDVSLRNAKRLHKSWKNSSLMITKGLGHRKILGDPKVVERIHEFLKL